MNTFYDRFRTNGRTADRVEWFIRFFAFQRSLESIFRYLRADPARITVRDRMILQQVALRIDGYHKDRTVLVARYLHLKDISRVIDLKDLLDRLRVAL